MHDYRYYIKDNLEHYEIWSGKQLYRHESAPFGEGVYDLLGYNDTQLKSVISFNDYYKHLAIEYFKSKQDDVLRQNDSLVFIYNSNLFMFLYDVFEQYRDNKIQIAPEKNTWLNFNIEREDKSITFDKLITLVSFVEGIVSAWSKGEIIDNCKLLCSIRRFSVTFELRDDELVEVLHPHCVEDIICYTLCKAYFMITDKKMCVNTCRRCNRYFSTFKYGRSVQYCNHKNDTGYTCKEEAEMSVVGRKMTDKEKQIRKLYLKVYNTQRRRWQKGEISKDCLNAWAVKGRQQRKKKKKGEITEEDFIKWLDENKDNYTEP